MKDQDSLQKKDKKTSKTRGEVRLTALKCLKSRGEVRLTTLKCLKSRGEVRLATLKCLKSCGEVRLATLKCLKSCGEGSPGIFDVFRPVRRASSLELIFHGKRWWPFAAIASPPPGLVKNKKDRSSQTDPSF